MTGMLKKTTDRRREVLGLLGFLLVATAQVSNMILARGVAGTVPPFTIAFFRWSIVAVGLLPAVVMTFRASPGLSRSQGLGIAAAGFLGMFVCGGPVYVAGVTTSAINIALIMALAPLVVLLISWLAGVDTISRRQVIGMLISLAGAALIITRGHASVKTGVASGDLLALLAMFGWAGYTLIQNRVGGNLSFLARIGLFAYSAYAYLGSAFGAVSTSLSPYLGPIVSAVLSIAFLGEAPTMIHLIGGALSLSGMWWSLQAKSSASR